MTRLLPLACFLVACSSASFEIAPTGDAPSLIVPDDTLLPPPTDGPDTSDAGGKADTRVTPPPDAVLEAALDSAKTEDTRAPDTAPAPDTNPATDTDADIDPGEACELLAVKGAPHCATGQTCDLDDAHKPYCRTTNVAGTWGKCTLNEECNANATCFYASGATSGTCMLLCRSDADCCSGGPCSTGFDCKKSPPLYTSTVTGSTYGVCRS